MNTKPFDFQSLVSFRIADNFNSAPDFFRISACECILSDDEHRDKALSRFDARVRLCLESEIFMIEQYAKRHNIDVKMLAFELREKTLKNR
jgi:hypothetical protein